MNLTCPECKNPVDLTPYPHVAPELVVECDMCGITLLVKSVNGNTVKADIMDEGK